jgi:putative ABC transport system ATP-binding protein
LNKDFGKTMLIVTHDRNIANQAGRVIHLEKGIIVDGATA